MGKQAGEWREDSVWALVSAGILALTGHLDVAHKALSPLAVEGE